MGKVFAAADIGSNTAHLLVAELAPNGIKRLANESVWLSLGEIVTREGVIPPALVDTLVDTIRSYKRTAELHRAEQFFVFATEAMRLARNHNHILTRIFDSVGVKITIITPQREAELSVSGISLDCAVQGEFVMVEVGGGSAQIAHCVESQIVQEKSLSIGTGKLRAMFQDQIVGHHDIEKIELHIKESLREFEPPDSSIKLFASGGIARGLVRALHPDGQKEIKAYELDYAIRTAIDLTTEQLARRFGVKLKRAQSILPGALVYKATLNHLNRESIFVSEYGVREGAVLDMANRQASIA